MNEKGYNLIELVIKLLFILLLCVSAVLIFLPNSKEAITINKLYDKITRFEIFNSKEVKTIWKGNMSDERYTYINNNIICDVGIVKGNYDSGLYLFDKYDFFKILTNLKDGSNKHDAINKIKSINKEINFVSTNILREDNKRYSFYMPESYIKKDFYNYDKEGYCINNYYDNFEIVPFSVMKNSTSFFYYIYPGQKTVFNKIKELKKEINKNLNVYITKKIQKNSLNNTPGEFLSKEEFIRNEAGNFQINDYESYVTKDEIGTMYEQILNDLTKKSQ